MTTTSNPIYRHTICDTMIKARMYTLACIGCGGVCMYFDMNIPPERRDVSDPDNRKWLIENLALENSEHELYNDAMEKLMNYE
jgi:hypothetical protein